MIVPGLFRHRLARGETLIGLSRRIYGGTAASNALASLNGIDDPAELAATLRDRVGVVEHGLFLGMASEVIVAKTDGIRIMK